MYADLVLFFSSYFATISIGTPPVQFEVSLDTGSADLIIVSAPCVSGCDSTTPLYHASASSTSTSTPLPFAINYEIGSGSGTIATDVVSIGGYTASQSFGAVTTSTSTVGAGGVTGVFGLAFKTLSTMGETPFIQRLYEAGQLAQPLFAFAPARWGSSSSTTHPGGVMNIGSVDSSLFDGQINYLPNTSPYYWQVALSGLSVAGTPIVIKNAHAIIDTGTTNIYVPAAVATTIYSLIPGSQAGASGMWNYPCASAIDLEFTMGGVAYSVAAEDFNIGLATLDGLRCWGVVGAIAPDSQGNDRYILGDAFRTSYSSLLLIMICAYHPYLLQSRTSTQSSDSPPLPSDSPSCPTLPLSKLAKYPSLQLLPSLSQPRLELSFPPPRLLLLPLTISLLFSRTALCTSLPP